MTSFPKSCIFIRPTQNWTGWKRWVLVEKINAIWWNIKINLQKIGKYVDMNRQQICKISHKKQPKWQYDKKF